MSETRSPYLVSGLPKDPNENTLLPFANSNFEQPTPEDVRAIISRLKLTGSQVAALVGVDSRTVRKWVSPASASTHHKIPYAAWRLLLAAGKIVDFPTLEEMPYQ